MQFAGVLILPKIQNMQPVPDAGARELVLQGCATFVRLDNDIDLLEALEVLGPRLLPGFDSWDA